MIVEAFLLETYAMEVKNSPVPPRLSLKYNSKFFLDFRLLFHKLPPSMVLAHICLTNQTDIFPPFPRRKIQIPSFGFTTLGPKA